MLYKNKPTPFIGGPYHGETTTETGFTIRRIDFSKPPVIDLSDNATEPAIFFHVEYTRHLLIDHYGNECWVYASRELPVRPKDMEEIEMLKAENFKLTTELAEMRAALGQLRTMLDPSDVLSYINRVLGDVNNEHE